jgi:uncharacterized protein (TIGR02453 family)
MLPAMGWFVYLVRCADGTLYTGVSTDPRERVRAHNDGRGARYTRARRPVALVHVEAAVGRAAALRREWAIKQWPRALKETLVAPGPAEKPMKTRFPGFGPGTATFFRQLARHNRREWFTAHREQYETEVLGPLRSLVQEVDLLLSSRAPEIVGDARRSVFRIHRDVRFSRDKSPYKTHAACWFYHRDAGRGVGSEADHGGAGFYFHFSPKECFLGGGIWMPPRVAVTKIRQAMAAHPEKFLGIVEGRAFRRRFGGLDDEAVLKRLPRGFDPGHPAEKWLRYQSFTCGREVSLREARSPSLPRTLMNDYERLLPFVRWLNAALGFPPGRPRPPKFLEDLFPADEEARHGKGTRRGKTGLEPGH